MRFKSWPRHPFTDTPRKRAALRRKHRKEQEALPLFSDQIAEAQPNEDAVMEARSAAWDAQEIADRNRRAANWREARRRISALPGSKRGHRADHPTTAIIMWFANRRAVLARLADHIPEGENYRAMHRSGD